jgi:hypothetical protein
VSNEIIPSAWLEIADVEIPAAKQRLEIGKLKDPRPHTPTAGIEPLRLHELRAFEFDGSPALVRMEGGSNSPIVFLAGSAVEELCNHIRGIVNRPVWRQKGPNSA